MQDKTSYNVFLRIKPLDISAIDDRLNSDTLSATESMITTTHTNKKNEIVRCQYNFQKVFKPSASQADIFEAIVCPRLRDFWQGSNCLLFSYGTSNSGKSYTIQGTPTDPGIIPRVLNSIFQSIGGNLDPEFYMVPYLSCQAGLVTQQDRLRYQAEKLKVLEDIHQSRAESLDSSLSCVSSDQITMVLEDMPVIPSNLYENVLCSAWISFYEIYNEQIFDLLAYNCASLKNPLKLGHDKEDDSYHPLNLRVIRATTWDEAYDLYRYGKRNLRVAETLLNRKSSRSHCVFTLKLLFREEDETDQFIAVRSFILCDLAGSERMKHTDDLGKIVVKEMLNINTSLLTLNKCFIELKKESQKSSNECSVPPYRDSKLTMLFKKFLKGQGQLTMIANISQEADMFYQTEQILKMTSLAYNTRVEKRCSEKLAFKLPKRRFSTMFGNEPQLTTPLSSLRANVLLNENHINRPVATNACCTELNKQIKQLKFKNSELEKEVKRSTDLLISNQNREESERNELLLQIKHLEERLKCEGSSTDYYKQKAFELEEKYRNRVHQANMKELEYHERLTDQLENFEDLMNILKTEFDVPSNAEPRATVQQVVYLHKNCIEAATEEVADYESALEDLKSVVAERDEEIAKLKGRLMDLEAYQKMEEEVRNNNKSERTEDSEADDETTPCHNENELFVHERVKSHGKAQWISDDESSPLYFPPKSKTTIKKKKKKTKMSTDVPYHGSCVKAKGDNVPLSSLPRARRQLLRHAPDFLGDETQLDFASPDSQMSPGSIMKKTLRSGKRL